MIQGDIASFLITTNPAALIWLHHLLVWRHGPSLLGRGSSRVRSPDATTCRFMIKESR